LLNGLILDYSHTSQFIYDPTTTFHQINSVLRILIMFA